MDALGQALNDRGFADAWLAEQCRVVLGPAGQHLDGRSGPPELGVMARTQSKQDEDEDEDEGHDRQRRRRRRRPRRSPSPSLQLIRCRH